MFDHVEYLDMETNLSQPELLPAPPTAASAFAASEVSSEVAIVIEALTLALLGFDDFREWCWCCFC